MGAHTGGMSPWQPTIEWSDSEQFTLAWAIETAVAHFPAGRGYALRRVLRKARAHPTAHYVDAAAGEVAGAGAEFPEVVGRLARWPDLVELLRRGTHAHEDLRDHAAG